MPLIKTNSFELATYQQGNEAAKQLILCLPGQLDTKDYPHMRSHVDYFGERGYLAVSFDPPGTWGSPGGIELYTMTNYLKAVDELIEHFGNKPTTVMGHSRGGSVAMVAGMRNKIITNFIAVMSHTSPSQLGQGKREGNAEIKFRDTPPDDREHKTIFHLPLSYFEDAAHYNPLDALKTCTKPKLFVRGMKDTIVDPEEIMVAYANAAEPKEYREVNSEHDYRRHPEVIAEVNRIIENFLERN